MAERDTTILVDDQIDALESVDVIRRAGGTIGGSYPTISAFIRVVAKRKRLERSNR